MQNTRGLNGAWAGETPAFPVKSLSGPVEQTLKGAGIRKVSEGIKIK